MSENCPKCGAPRALQSCPKCGLMYKKYTSAIDLNGVPESVQQLWNNVEQNWDDAPSHALFVEQALRHDAAGYAASRYRSKTDDPTARQQLEKLTQRLMQSLEAHSSQPKETPSGMRNMLYVLSFVIIAILVFLIFAQSMK